MMDGLAPAPRTGPRVQQSSNGVEAKALAKKYVGRHKFKVNGIEFDVDRKYYPLKVLGEGAYGIVCLVEDRELGAKVAIKKMTEPFADMVDAKRILREIKLLRHLDHENIVPQYDLVPPRELGPIKDVYIVMGSMEANLHKIIYSKQELTLDHIQYFMFQLFLGLKYLHSAGVIHRDLKPSNLLVNHDCELKICDFGLARGMEAIGDDAMYTEYVVTRHYRAPEVMTNAKHYDQQIDVWAAGCIFAELLQRKALFPGQDYLEQLRLIIQTCGSPTDDDFKDIPTKAARTFIRSLGDIPPPNWRARFPKASGEAADLLSKLLIFSPKRRYTVDQALKHPFFASLVGEAPPRVAKTKFDFSWEETPLNAERIQEIAWQEIYHYRPATKEPHQAKMKAAKAARKASSSSPSSGSPSSQTTSSSRSTTFALSPSPSSQP